jgi:ribosome maturation factor RimP
VADIAGLQRLIEPEVKSLGYDLVRVMMIGGASDPTLQVMAERPDTRQLDITDCERGIDRPLTRLKDFSDWTGHEARITLHHARGDRKQFTGTLLGVDGETVGLRAKDGQDYDLPFADISSAKLVLTDKLIQATAPLSTEGADTIETVEE